MRARTDMGGAGSGMQASGRAVKRLAESMRAAAAVDVSVLPGLGDHPVAQARDVSSGLYNRLADFLTEAIPSLRRVNKETRAPEALGLRPLPQFASLEEAMRALRPRAVPTAEAVEAELRKLAAEDDCPSEEDEAPNGHQTALAKDSSQYFGFVG